MDFKRASLTSFFVFLRLFFSLVTILWSSFWAICFFSAIMNIGELEKHVWSVKFSCLLKTQHTQPHHDSIPLFLGELPSLPLALKLPHFPIQLQQSDLNQQITFLNYATLWDEGIILSFYPVNYTIHFKPGSWKPTKIDRKEKQFEKLCIPHGHESKNLFNGRTHRCCHLFPSLHTFCRVLTLALPLH